MINKEVETVKTRPIVFSGEMTRAILDGQKTQTRRPVTSTRLYGINAPGIADLVAKKEAFLYKPDIPYYSICPYGKLGDGLWVREAIIRRKFHNLDFDGATYAADLTPVTGKGPLGSYCGRAILDWKWKRDKLSAYHAPKWASRITLEITDIRVEKLQDISIEDIKAEGTDFRYDPGTAWNEVYRNRFVELWDSINAKRGYSWDQNPWVFAITFKIAENDHERD